MSLYFFNVTIIYLFFKSSHKLIMCIHFVLALALALVPWGRPLIIQSSAAKLEMYIYIFNASQFHCMTPTIDGARSDHRSKRYA
jgi:hypothetical protein